MARVTRMLTGCLPGYATLQISSTGIDNSKIPVILKYIAVYDKISRWTRGCTLMHFMEF